MTMRLTITNTDHARTARVTTIDAGQAPATGEGRPVGNAVAEIGPGATADFYIHSGRSLTVEEVQPDAP